ncbi:2,3-bisphosphoglycerate-independent phosphoglycerate mutase [Intestinibaculum porci]|uniref:2,3-bisphosphoglycerate-independent phosphoglycerate mutase n=1 Tax=Intestinibaculum porci TaxID=2487118 RepID=UPI003C6D0166
MVFGKGEKATSPTQAIESSYQKEVFDEFVVPTVIYNGDKPVATIDDGDSVIFFNFRPDRARQITRALVDPEFNEFETKKMNLNFVCMTEYDATMPNVKVAFKPEKLTNTFGEYISKLGMKQLRIAETEKYAHVTFFMDGGVDKDIEGATRDLINSPKVATYDLQPEMSAYLVRDKLIEELDSGKFDVVIVNFANCDMVGHTGIIPAAISAVETVDECVGDVYDKVLELGGTMLITADHGNAERELDEEGNPFTAHTTNDVPLIVTNSHIKLKEGGKLGDLAPTILTLLGQPVPAEMTGDVLIENDPDSFQ